MNAMNTRKATLNGRALKHGDAITNFRDEAWIFLYVSPSSDGRKITVRAPGSSEADAQEFFPSAFPGLQVSQAI